MALPCVIAEHHFSNMDLVSLPSESDWSVNQVHIRVTSPCTCSRPPVPQLAKNPPAEISTWFRSGLNQTGAKLRLIFAGGKVGEVGARGWRRRQP